MSKDYTFNPGDFVVYPTRGVGQITDRIVLPDYGDGEFWRIEPVKKIKGEKPLCIPVSKAVQNGLRQISTPALMDIAVHTLQGRAKVKRLQWTKRSKEYDTKINSGNPIAMAEVLRDLYKNPSLCDQKQTCGEREIYEKAMLRFSTEYALVKNISEDDAISKLESILKNKSDK